MAHRVWAAIALICAACVGAQLIAAALAGAAWPDPVAGLFAADVRLAAGASGTTPAAVAALAATTDGAAVLRVDLISRASASRAVLLRNSVPVARFRRGSVRVAVAAGDLLEIDGTAYRRPLTFQVVTATDLLTPPVGQRVTTRGDIVVLGRVTLPTP